jgi:hypothetical protein
MSEEGWIGLGTVVYLGLGYDVLVELLNVDQ